MTQTHFGNRTVDLDQKPHLVRDLFQGVAGKYDVMNDVMSFGIHRLWKDALIDWVRPKAGQRFLDVAGGTGDVAFRIDAAVKGQQSEMVVCDLTPGMLEEGKARADKKTGLGPFTWICGDATALPFEDNTFDVYTIAFGLRNVAEPEKALAEAKRVLKPGGRFFCLEFSQVELPLLDQAYDFFSFNIIPTMGQMVAGDRESYQYLVESIRKFPDQETLKTMMGDQGLALAFLPKLKRRHRGHPSGRRALKALRHILRFLRLAWSLARQGALTPFEALVPAKGPARFAYRLAQGGLSGAGWRAALASAWPRPCAPKALPS